MRSTRCCARSPAQRDRRFEVVVADDGSGPATAALVERWQPRHRRAARPTSGRSTAAFAPPRCATARSSRRTATTASSSTATASCARTSSRGTGGSPSAGWFVTGNRVLLSRAADRCRAARRAAAGNLEPRGLDRAALGSGGVNRLAAAAAPAARSAAQARSAQSGRARAPAISRSGVPISTRSTDLTRASTAGAARIPTCWCGCCMPACGARTAASRPASSISGIRPPTARN